MLVALAVTAAWLPVYLWIRRPYADLPLHIDTGFYVSNRAVTSGGVRYADGWNAHFAGCSKVLPEYFYSLVYSGARGDPATRGAAYRRRSRLFASLYNYLTAVAVGVVASQCGGDVRYYLAGLIAYSMLSSEPQWGVYYECGELFENLWHVLAVALILAGVQTGAIWWYALAGFVLVAEVAFIKLSSAIGLIVVGTAACVFAAAEAVVVGAIGGFAALLIYFVWIRANGQRVAALFGRVRGHESSFSRSIDTGVVLMRAREKAGLLFRTLCAQPAVVFPGVAGAVALMGHEPIWCVYLLATLATFAAQATDCWYYQIPLLPPIALAAASGAVWLTSGIPGMAVVVAFLLLWTYSNVVQTRRMSAHDLHRWVWNRHVPERTIALNECLQAACGGIAERVAGRSMLVYGPLNQAYVLTGAGFPTPLVAPEHYLDDVCAGWQARLNEQLIVAPPGFVLDTGNCFDAAAARDGLGLEYALANDHENDMRLFELMRRGEPAGDIACVHTFRAMPPAGVIVRPQVIDAVADRLARTLRELAARGVDRIAIYGAGRFTARYVGVYRNAPVEVVALIDDQAGRFDGEYLGWSVVTPSAATSLDFEAVVISTDRFTSPMAAKARRWGGGVQVVSVSGDTASGLVESAASQ